MLKAPHFGLCFLPDVLSCGLLLCGVTVGRSWAFPGECSDYRAGLSDFCCAHSLVSMCALELDLLWNGRVLPLGLSSGCLAEWVGSFLLCCKFYQLKAYFENKQVPYLMVSVNKLGVWESLHSPPSLPLKLNLSSEVMARFFHVSLRRIKDSGCVDCV